MTRTPPPSGDQFTITHGDQRFRDGIDSDTADFMDMFAANTSTSRSARAGEDTPSQSWFE
jgi:hypothetical protein